MEIYLGLAVGVQEKSKDKHKKNVRTPHVICMEFFILPVSSLV